MFIFTQIPKGTKDSLPKETRIENILKNRIRNSFFKWGYKEVITPTIEFEEVLSSNLGYSLSKRMFKFQDFDGEVLALRPEMTIPIVRMVTSRINKLNLPLRLSYISNVFRYCQSYSEREREFWQAGVELIGDSSTEADGEILALLITTLLEQGFTNFRIDIAHSQIIESLVKEFSLEEDDIKKLIEKIKIKDINYLNQLAGKCDISQDLFDLIIELISCQDLSSLSKQNLEQESALGNCILRLLEIRKILVDYNYEQFVFFDVALTSDIGYYSGLVFEVSIPEFGLIIGSGGRYDGLFDVFGKSELSGIGFALEIQKCILCLNEQNPTFINKKRTQVLIQSSDRKAGISLASLLRKLSIETILEYQDKEKTVADISMKEMDCDYILKINTKTGKSIEVYDCSNKKIDFVSFEEIERIIEDRER